MTVETAEPEIVEQTELQVQPAVARNGGGPPKGRAGLGLKTPPDWPTIGRVALIVLLGLALRLWGIGWSLPNAAHPLATYHPDELVNLNAALAADIAHGKFDIGFYNYGAFYFYLVNFAQIFGRGYGLIPAPTPATDSNIAASLASLAPQQAGLFLAGRLVTALLGAATIAVVFAMGNRLGGKRTGYWAALLYAVAPLAVVHAHFLTVDVPATFFVSLALLWSLRLLSSQTWPDYALAAIWCGLAAATKYNAGLVIVAPILAHLLNRVPNACQMHRGGQFVVLLAVSLLAFLIGCPGPVLNLDAFWDGLPGYPGSGVRYELFVHSREGHELLFVNTGPGWWYHLAVSLNYGLGVPLLLLALAGVVYACVRRTRADIILLGFLLVYYGATGLSAVRFARYMIPLFPVFCAFAARLLTASAFKPNVVRSLQALGAAVLTLTTLYTVSLVRLMTAPDPRDVTATAMDRELPQGAVVTFAKIPWFYSPPLSPDFGKMAAPQRARAAQTTTRYQLRMPAGEWDTGVLNPLPDAIVISNIETLHAVDRLHLAGPTRFMDSIPAGYRRERFGPAPIFNLALPNAIIPEDLLYIEPTLTLYRK
jgi:4-amino-4-deoxy-L-arabinose transferase-like glycosyltransferase